MDIDDTFSAGQNFVVYTDLADTIEKLYQGHYITKSSRDAFHTIRMLGNKAVHEGDNDPQDAARSYRLLDQEINAFVSGGRSQEAPADRERPAEQTLQRERSSQKEQKLNIPGERTRVPVSRESLPSSQGSRRRYDNLDDRSTRDRREVPNREDRLRAQRKGQPARGGAHRGQRKPQQQGISIYDVLRILIPVICVILSDTGSEGFTKLMNRSHTFPSRTFSAPISMISSVSGLKPVVSTSKARYDFSIFGIFLPRFFAVLIRNASSQSRPSPPAANPYSPPRGAAPLSSGPQAGLFPSRQSPALTPGSPR